MISRVLDWITTRAQKAKSGDIVSIILIGHGNQKGIILGENLLKQADLTTACSLFAPDAQVNIVIKACRSGAFARAFKVTNQRSLYLHTSAKDDELSWTEKRSISSRFGNSVFGAAFVHTLGLMRDLEKRWALQKHIDFIRGRTNAPECHPDYCSTPQVVTDSPRTRMMKDIIYRDYIDITFNEAPVRARRVLTPQNNALIITQQPITRHVNHNSSEYKAACEVVGHEMRLIETDYPAHGE
jgi:Peptidase C13 family